MSTVEERLNEEDFTQYLIGKIPVRNLWVLLCYASDLYTVLRARGISIEDTPEDIPEILAEILCHEVNQRLRRPLTITYEETHGALTRVRGRIDVLTTARQRLLDKGLIACRYTEITVNTPKLCLARAALERLARRLYPEAIGVRCRQLVQTLRERGVTGPCPSLRSPALETRNALEAVDGPLLAAAKLAFLIQLPSENEGDWLISALHRQGLNLPSLFEKSIAGFFAVHLSQRDWKVRAQSWFEWQTSESSEPGLNYLPSMRPDIVIDTKDGERLVIDTKCKPVFIKNQMEACKFRSADLYQIYAYLLSQANPETPSTLRTRGMLLYPETDHQSVDEYVTIQGHPIRFATVNLMGSAREIQKRLLELVTF